MITTRRLALCLLALLPLASCRSAFRSAVSGNGSVITEPRTGLEDFESIEMFGGLHLDIEVGGPVSVEVLADSNLQPLLITEVKDGVLQVGHREEIDPTETIVASIRVPRLEALDISGGAHIDVRGVEAEELECEFSGAVTGSIAGSATRCELDTSGAMELDLRRLAVQEMEVEASGSCNLKVRVEERLDVSVSGSGSVGYIGRPAVTLSQSGAARVYELED